MLAASSPASPRNSTPSKPKTPPSPSSNLPAAPWASCTSPPPPTPAIRAASRFPAPKAPSSSSTTASSPPACAILLRTLPQPSLQTRTKALHPLWSVIFAAIRPSSKTSSRPFSRTALRPATAPKAAAASLLSKPFIALQRVRRKPQTSKENRQVNNRNRSPGAIISVTKGESHERKERKERNVAAHVSVERRRERCGVCDRAQACPRPWIYSAERHPEHRRHWSRRHGPQQSDQPRKPEHRGAVRRGLGLCRQGLRWPRHQHPESAGAHRPVESATGPRPAACRIRSREGQSTPRCHDQAEDPTSAQSHPLSRLPGHARTPARH